jgi:hypothetical protein
VKISNLSPPLVPPHAAATITATTAVATSASSSSSSTIICSFVLYELIEEKSPISGFHPTVLPFKLLPALLGVLQYQVEPSCCRVSHESVSFENQF